MMGKLKTAYKLLLGDKSLFAKKVFDNFAKTKISHCLSDKLYLKLQYRSNFHKKLNLKDPKTFNEKLQWLKLFNRDLNYPKMVDKYDVRNYISDIIGEEYLIPCLGVWNSADEIDYKILPEKFVLKCTHDSGSVMVCNKQTLDINQVKKHFDKKITSNMFWWGREWPYKNLKPKIIAEQFMQDESGELRDYKFMCFNGEVKCIFICSDRFSEKGLHVTFFDKEWNVLPFERSFPSVKEGFPQPKNYDMMVTLAEKLSKDIPFVRVDFYEINNKIYFGELTFFPGNGMESFQPEEWDLVLGDWIELPEQKRV